MNPALSSIYVYYRVAPARQVEVPALVQSMQNELMTKTGVRGRIMRKDDMSNTWMEIYEGIADCAAFEKEMDAVVTRKNFATLLAPDSDRHLERFVGI